MLTCDPTGAGQPVRSSSATPFHALGERMVDSAGRVYRYAKAGASALVAGFMQQAPAVVTTHQACTVATAAIGAQKLTLTLGAVNAVTANQYAGGFVTISAGTGIGYSYRIKSHPAAAHSTDLVVTLADDDLVQVATAVGDSKGDLTANPYNGVIISPTTLTNVPVGVAVYPIPASEYGWLQTHGPCPLSTEGTPAVGMEVAVPTDTAGQAKVLVADSSALVTVGLTMQVGIDESVKMTFLTLE